MLSVEASEIDECRSTRAPPFWPMPKPFGLRRDDRVLAVRGNRNGIGLDADRSRRQERPSERRKAETSPVTPAVPLTTRR